MCSLVRLERHHHPIIDPSPKNNHLTPILDISLCASEFVLEPIITLRTTRNMWYLVLECTTTTEWGLFRNQVYPEQGQE